MRWRDQRASNYGYDSNRSIEELVEAVNKSKSNETTFACRFGYRNALHRTHEVILQVNCSAQTYLIRGVHGTKCSRAATYGLQVE